MVMAFECVCVSVSGSLNKVDSRSWTACFSEVFCCTLDFVFYNVVMGLGMCEHLLMRVHVCVPTRHRVYFYHTQQRLRLFEANAIWADLAPADPSLFGICPIKCMVWIWMATRRHQLHNSNNLFTSIVCPVALVCYCHNFSFEQYEFRVRVESPACSYCDLVDCSF